MFHDIQTLENLESADLNMDYRGCFDEYIAMNGSELQQVIRESATSA